MNDLTTIILAELAKHGIKVANINDNSRNIQAFCFNGHDHDTPSLSIRKSDGAFFCFGCGTKGPNWNVLAEKIGAKTIDDGEMPNPFGIMYEYIEKAMTDSGDVTLPMGAIPWAKGAWRSLPEKFLKMLGAYFWYDSGVHADRILFPIIQLGSLAGWVARRLDDGRMKYRNSSDLRSREILYPYDFVYDRDPRTIVLVEGPFDALRLLRFRIPALAFMGTNNFTEENAIMLSSFVSEVIVCTDNDDAGNKCRKNIVTPICKDYGLKVSHFFPPKGSDPGDMPLRYIRKLKEICS